LTFAVSTDQKTVTINTSGLAAATTYHLGLSYWVYLYDWAGNYDPNYEVYYFTTQWGPEAVVAAQRKESSRCAANTELVSGMDGREFLRSLPPICGPP
jgi:hypothetical protein